MWGYTRLLTQVVGLMGGLIRDGIFCVIGLLAIIGGADQRAITTRPSLRLIRGGMR